MDLLQVKDNQIVDAQGAPVMLRGACVGGWMNMENFINGYPGAEHSLRRTFAQILGPEKAQFFFERWLDYFLDEADIAFMKSLGATVVRLSVNYRHFEDDAQPFEYLEAGFARLDRAIEWCARHGLYAIIDLHAVQGWQNTDWHSDNSSRHSLFWQHPHFQERFIALWQEFARHYKGNPAIAGYNLMNEPVNNAPGGRFSNTYATDWDSINRIYRRTVEAIRTIDTEHIIFLEGDYFSTRFDGLEAPFAANLVYSSHNYTAAGFGPGPYPGTFGGQQWNRAYQETVLLTRQGTQFAQRHTVPLWVGEFGAVYNGPAEEIPDRVQALDDQLEVFNAHRIHWTMWTYKDVGVMGWVTVNPQSAFMQRTAQLLEAKRELGVDFWMGWLPSTPVREQVRTLARCVEAVLNDPLIDPQANEAYLAQATLSGYIAQLMQPTFAHLFASMTETQLDDLLAAFAFKNCIPHTALMKVLRARLNKVHEP